MHPSQSNNKKHLKSKYLRNSPNLPTADDKSGSCLSYARFGSQLLISDGDWRVYTNDVTSTDCHITRPNLHTSRSREKAPSIAQRSRQVLKKDKSTQCHAASVQIYHPANPKKWKKHQWRHKGYNSHRHNLFTFIHSSVVSCAGNVLVCVVISGEF